LLLERAVVTNFDDAMMEVREEQLVNMPPMNLTWDVSKEERSSEVRDEQP
jgi:hypothetical protein